MYISLSVILHTNLSPSSLCLSVTVTMLIQYGVWMGIIVLWKRKGRSRSGKTNKPSSIVTDGKNVGVLRYTNQCLTTITIL